MIIDISTLEEKRLEHFKGGEGTFLAKMCCDSHVKIMQGRLVPDAGIGYHKHEGNSEIIFLLQGEGSVCFDGKAFTLHAGQVHYCPKGHEHSLCNKGQEDLLFYAVVPEHHE